MQISPRILLLVFAASLAGCAQYSAEDERDFKTETLSQLELGMPLQKANDNMTQLGLTCTYVSNTVVTCSKVKERFLLYSCVQSIGLDIAPDTQTVSRITPQNIACSGM